MNPHSESDETRLCVKREPRATHHSRDKDAGTQPQWTWRKPPDPNDSIASSDTMNESRDTD